MKRKITLYLIPLCLAIYVLLSSNSSGPAAVANSDYSGSPLGGSTCANCHGGGTGVLSLSLTLTDQATSNVVTSYTPGSTYDLSFALSNSAGSLGGYGFQLTALTTSGNSPIAGYSNLGTNVQLSNIGNGATYVEHSFTNTSSNTFQMEWTAPVAGTGEITFYAGGNNVNSNGGTSGDLAATNTFVFPEAVVANPIAITLDSQTNQTCNGDSSGVINITVSGGTGSYTFSWSDLPGTINVEDRSGLSAGTYNLTVTDANNASQSASYTITEPDPIVISADAPIAACNGDDVLVTLSATGGAGDYWYDFGDGLGLTSTDTASLTAGTYKIYADDANLCLDSLTFTVLEPDPLAITVDNIIGDSGSGTGAIEISVSGGTEPYDYTWSNGDDVQDISGLSTGTFDIIVEDDSECVTSLMNIEVTLATSISSVFSDLIQVKVLPQELLVQNVNNETVRLSLITLQGQVILSEEIRGNKRISTETLTSGIYFYTLTNNKLGKKYSGKFIHK